MTPSFDEMTLLADESCDGERLDAFAAKRAAPLSRSYVKKLTDDGLVTLNGSRAKASGRIKSGDVVQIFIPKPREAGILPENIPLDILYEDDDILIVNKPKGMPVHPSAGHESGTLVNALMYYCRDNLSGINGSLRPGIVHRIDMDTSGSLVVCKNDFAHRKIAEQLKSHSVKRVYDAIVCGDIKEDRGIIDAPIGRHPIKRKQMSTHSKSPKRAVTHYEVISRFKGYTYIECRLQTGRTHQIRVHMASIGHPLLGDHVYGSGTNPFNLKSQALHARILGLIHPRTGEYIEVEAPLPAYFRELLEKLSKQGF